MVNTVHIITKSIKISLSQHKEIKKNFEMIPIIIGDNDWNSYQCYIDAK